MDRILKKDNQARKAALLLKWLYGLAGLAIALAGLWTGDSYRFFLSLGSLGLIPALNLFYRLAGLLPGWQLEVRIYIFAILGITLGGCLEFYQRITGYDKLVHMLSGVLTAILAFSLYLYLERDRPVTSLNPATALLFCFFASMAVAGIFEIGEFLLAPLVGRDMQQVAATGVADTMLDMIVCLLGSLLTMPLLARFFQGREHQLTDAAAAFYYKNSTAAVKKPQAGSGLATD